MGTKNAPSNAIIFMGKFEKQLLESSIERPLSWYRFIDGVDMKWTQSLDNTLFVIPSFQIIFKLTQSFCQRFVGGANSPDSKSLTVWYALSHRTFFHVTITYIPPSSSLMKYLTLPFPSSTLLALYRKVYYPQIYTPNLPTPINTCYLAAVILLIILFVAPSFQIIFKLTQSSFQRFVGGANSPDSKSLTVWYALSHMRRMTAARQKVLI
jgi:hypothetical protein